jgi:hypothetical protein
MHESMYIELTQGKEWLQCYIIFPNKIIKLVDEKPKKPKAPKVTKPEEPTVLKKVHLLEEGETLHPVQKEMTPPNRYDTSSGHQQEARRRIEALKTEPQDFEGYEDYRFTKEPSSTTPTRRRVEGRRYNGKKP